MKEIFEERNRKSVFYKAEDLKEIIRTEWQKEDNGGSGENLLQCFFENKEHFALVFETSSGSLYFHTKDGSTLRFKKENSRYRPQPLTSSLYFVSSEDGTRLMGDLKHLAPGISFKSVPFSLGSVPVEINIADYPYSIKTSQDGEKITLTHSEFNPKSGEDPEKIEDQLVGGIHIGHPVSKIIFKQL